MQYHQNPKGTEKYVKDLLASTSNIPADEINDEHIEFMMEYVNQKSSGKEFIKEKKELPSTPAGISSIHFLLCKTYYNINIKNTTLTALGLVLDILVTMGVTSALLASMGLIGRTIAKLNKTNGEVCLYLKALRLKKDGNDNFTKEDIFKIISTNVCQYSGFLCIFNKKNICSLEQNDLDNVFDSLLEKAVLAKSTNYQWRLEL